MMDNIITTAESLAEIVRKITEGLLLERCRDRFKRYVKLDFNILKQERFFSIQVTKCKRGYPNLKILLKRALKKRLISQKLNLGMAVAIVEEKSENSVLMWKVIYSRKSSLSLVTDQTLDTQKEFSTLKRYISIKPLFRVQNIYLEEFKSLLMCHLLQIEQIETDFKFVIRVGDTHIHRNYVRMDDIVLACKSLSSSCTTIFQNSQNNSLRKNLMTLLNIRKRKSFEESIGYLLLDQANYFI